MTDEAFAGLVAEHPAVFFEMIAEGELIANPPNYTLHGVRNAVMGAQLADWAHEDGRGYTFASVSGFVLPNGARRSADLSWIPRIDIARLSEEELEGYWHLCPAFVLEQRSYWETLDVLRERMREWIANGAQLAWLIDPQTCTVEIYRPNQEAEILENPTTITAGDPIAGFALDLQRVWEPIKTRPS